MTLLATMNMRGIFFLSSRSASSAGFPWAGLQPLLPERLPVHELSGLVRVHHLLDNSMSYGLPGRPVGLRDGVAVRVPDSLLNLFWKRAHVENAPVAEAARLAGRGPVVVEAALGQQRRRGAQGVALQAETGLLMDGECAAPQDVGDAW
jgi:hypothetical protein